MTTAMRVKHPAAFPAYMLDRLALYLSAERRELARPLRILDPFAGVGRIHDLPKRLGTTVGVEIEPEWAEQRDGTIQGDATALPADWSMTFDAVVTSPTYANRLADSHEAKDACAICKGTGTNWTDEGCADAVMICPDCHSVACACGGFRKAMLNHNRTCGYCSRRLCSTCNGSGLSKRYTYRHALGRLPSEGSSSTMQWSNAYRELHSRAWAEAHRVLRPNGLMLVNVKNHIRNGTEQLVVEWHVVELKRQGFAIVDVAAIDATSTIANNGARVDCERIIRARSKP